jgi:hypothetical protein
VAGDRLASIGEVDAWSSWPFSPPLCLQIVSLPPSRAPRVSAAAGKMFQFVVAHLDDRLDFKDGAVAIACRFFSPIAPSSSRTKALRHIVGALSIRY